MKRVVSVSLGSSTRDHSVETELLGQKILIERIGTDGDLNKAISLISSLDGNIDAIGMGGIDLYISAGGTRYMLRDAKKLARAAKITPIVDGSGLKNTLEKKVISFLQENVLDFNKKKVFMVCGVDRFGMAQSFHDMGALLTFGDLLFGLGIPIVLNSLKSLERAARIMAPVISQVPFKLLYPTGVKQEAIVPKYASYYQNNDIIAGDFHFIKRHLPDSLPGKIIITNTVTENDVALLSKKGLNMLITTTPELKGRSFGTNVMEALLIAVAGNGKSELTSVEYSGLLDKIEFKPRIIKFTEEKIV